MRRFTPSTLQCVSIIPAARVAPFVVRARRDEQIPAL
jgi:hypothetical protein